MPPSSRRPAWADERGSTTLEFLSIGVILLVPLVYLVLALASLQGAQLASEGAARQAARVYVQAASASDGSAEAARAVEFALQDFGIDPAAATVDIRCTAGPGCLAPGGTVTVVVRTEATLPLGLGGRGIHVEAVAVQPVSRFRP